LACVFRQLQEPPRVPIDLFADRGNRSLDLLAFGFVANQSHF
jgi:hypothetical protein